MSILLHSLTFDRKPVRPNNQARREIPWGTIKALIEDDLKLQYGEHIVQLNLTTTGVAVITEGRTNEAQG